jgi:hypothetical protein
LYTYRLCKWREKYASKGSFNQTKKHPLRVLVLACMVASPINFSFKSLEKQIEIQPLNDKMKELDKQLNETG